MRRLVAVTVVLAILVAGTAPPLAAAAEKVTVGIGGVALMVYLPTEKILAEADAYTPPETPTTPLITPKFPYAAALYDNIQRLNLDVQTIAPFHGARIHDLAEVAKQAGR